MPLKFQPQTPPSVSPDGLIVSGGGPDTTLMAIKDGGDHGEVAGPATTSAAVDVELAGDVGRLHGDARRDGMALLVFDPADGHTVNSYPLPGATG